MTSLDPALAAAAADPAPQLEPAAPRHSRTRRHRPPAKVLVGGAITLFFVLMALFGPLLAPHSASWVANTTNGTPQAPTGSLWLGTDNMQHDLFSLLLIGSRSTLLIAFLAGAIATVLSVAVGVTAGYVGGVADEILSALSNIFLALPGLLILMVIISPLPVPDKGNSFVIGLVVAITSWAYGARALRAQTLALRGQDYVVSARVIGERRIRIILFEIVPNLLPIVAASFIFTVIYGLGVYVALCYLGVVSPSSGSWGTMLQGAQSNSAIGNGWWWWYLPPALAVALVGLGLALLNFGIDEIINPRIRSARTGRGGVKFQLGLTPVVRAAAREGDAR
ncbi:ABC transporter permease [Actinospica sp. MGRD01-02]|uniref:ABC transporter permease n=1 Tax=Actinospica acidithermotolerans TaxID=2828514 RepID=A0A941IF70_9ACTN|nr:ABC transporter permease [Actinospica acidithermotolerans]MBR7826005.1 ABC transporter permease [Actinospica acidithermotolerans]